MLTEYPKSLCQLIVDATGKELAGFDIDAVYDSGHQLQIGDKTKLAMILFLGHEMSGIFSILCDEKVLLATYPLEKHKVTKKQTDDWLAELTNTLIGRIRAEFTTYGLEIDISIPKLVPYHQLKEAEITLAPFTNFAFKTKAGYLHALFAADISQNIDLEGIKKIGAVVGPSGSAHLL